MLHTQAVNMDIIFLKLSAYLPKVLAAVIGAVFCLMLSGDIGDDAKVKINLSVVMKFTIAVTISLFAGSAHIELYGLQDYGVMTHGAIMLGWAVFGMLIIGIIYQSLAMMQGKPLSEVAREIKQAFLAIFKS